jgi:RHS repeat-associated protein
MGVTNYTLFDGEIVSEDREGVLRDYVPDPLGSTIALLDSSQAKTDTVTYWPYGEVRNRTGANATPYLFVGSLGYRKDTATRAYVRARELEANYARWMTVDPLWPFTWQYVYALTNPETYADHTGLLPKTRTVPTFNPGCPGSLTHTINALCDRIDYISNEQVYLINRCIAAAARRIGMTGCNGLTSNRVICIKRWCDTDGIVTCIASTTGLGGRCPGVPPFGLDFDRSDPSDELQIGVPPGGDNYSFAWLGTGNPGLEFFHELMHACGQQHNSTVSAKQCNDIEACCMWEVLRNHNDGHRCVNRI